MLQAGERVSFLALTPVDRDEVLQDLPGITLLEWPCDVSPAAKRGAVGALIALAPAFRRVVRHAAPDLVQAGPVLSCGFLAALSQSRPLFVVSWGHDILLDIDESDLARSMGAYALSMADRVVCDCDAVRLRAAALADLPEDCFVQFPWGIDLAISDSVQPHPCRKELGWEESFVLLSARSWETLYGVDTLIHGFAQACRSNHGLRLLLLGAGSERDRVAALIDELALGDVIHVVGRAPEAQVTEYMAAADAYVSCSKTDGSSVSLLQAMSVGLPAIVSDIPGNREWIGTPNGVLFATGDAGSLSDSILSVAALNPQDLRDIADENQALIKEKADWNRNVNKLIESHYTVAQVP